MTGVRSGSGREQERASDAKSQGFNFRDLPEISSQPTVEEEIRRAMQNYLGHALGRRQSQIDDLVRMDLARTIAINTIDGLESQGLTIKGEQVLDLGAGLGALSEELSRRGANVFSVEPGEVWRGVVKRRLREYRRSFVVGAVGERLPLSDNSVDLVVSLQVFEHVRDPAAVLKEGFRVCRPGGHFLFSCENYLSFREPHYDIFWLPLLPKPIGRLYLRLRGRCPEFLETAITYTTVPSIARAIHYSGFLSVREQSLAERIRMRRVGGVPWRRAVARALASALPSRVAGLAAIWMERMTRVLDHGIYELLVKPPIEDGGPTKG